MASYLYGLNAPLSARLRAYKVNRHLSTHTVDTGSRHNTVALELDDGIRAAYAEDRDITGYYGDDFQDSLCRPVVVRLSRRRGFLAGYSWDYNAGRDKHPDMVWIGDDRGRSAIHDDERDAGRAAHSMAENAAEEEREYQWHERQRFEAEEAEEARLDNLAECHPLSIPEAAGLSASE